MTFLAMAKTLAKDVGLAVPDQVAASSQREWVEALEVANEAGEELARRVDWGQLTGVATITGTGTAAAQGLPGGFSRITQGIGVTNATGAIVRPLTRAEWSGLTPVEGSPRYFLLEGTNISFWPFPANGEDVTVHYQSKFWCDNGSAKIVSDDNSSLIDEALHAKAMIVRWRRQKGMDVADYEAEYEAALQDFARFNDRSRL